MRFVPDAFISAKGFIVDAKGFIYVSLFSYWIRKPRDEYIAAIKAHADAVIAALATDSDVVDREYERASTDLMRKQEAYRQATENLRELGSRRD